MCFTVLAGAVAIPLAFSRDGYDHFRQPKELTAYAVVIIACTIAAAGAILGRLTIPPDERRALRPITAVVGAGAVWTLIATTFSTNRRLSIEATVWVFALIALFFLAAYVARRVPLGTFATALLAPALVNAVIVILQALRIWNPWEFPPGTDERMFNNALMGNPDDVAVYLIGPVMFAFAAAIYAGRHRWAYATAGAVMLAGIIASETMTGIAVAGVGVALLLVGRLPAYRLTAITAVLILTVSGMVAFAPTRVRIVHLAQTLEDGQWGLAARGRLPPLMTASRMFADRPLVGVGPGCFRFHYMPYRARVEEEHPRLLSLGETPNVNFGEVHNDHMQILAETGLPGLLIAAAGLILLAWISRARPAGPGSDTRRLAARLALPFAVVLTLTMIPQFPWHLAGPSLANVLIGGWCFAWRSTDVA